jgi:hypothetical protein
VAFFPILEDQIKSPAHIAAVVAKQSRMSLPHIWKFAEQ